MTSDNAAICFFGVIVGLFLGTISTSLAYGVDPDSQKNKHEACSEFINVYACDCWVKDRCGSDMGRASAKEGVRNEEQDN